MSASYLMDPPCRHILDEWAGGATLFVFDFDGTLAAREGEPGHGQMGADMWRQLDALAQTATVAVISARARTDLIPRLPPSVDWVLGTHGNEGLQQTSTDTQEQRRLCATWQSHLMSDATLWGDASGALIDNKGCALTLRYKDADNPVLARSRLLARAVKLSPAPRIIRGQDAIDLLPSRSPTKSDAIAQLMHANHCDRAVIIGHDISDEPMFSAAPSEWLTVHVGICVHTDARFVLRDLEEVGNLLSQLASKRQFHQARPGKPSPRHAMP